MLRDENDASIVAKAAELLVAHKMHPTLPDRVWKVRLSAAKPTASVLYSAFALIVHGGFRTSTHPTGSMSTARVRFTHRLGLRE